MADSTIIRPFIKSARVEIDGTMYDHHVRNVVFTPTVATQVFIPISGRAVTDATVTGWACSFEYAQDAQGTASDLQAFLHENIGKQLNIRFVPNGNATTLNAWSSTIYSLMPGQVGGAVGVATATSNSPCSEPSYGPWTEPV